MLARSWSHLWKWPRKSRWETWPEYLELRWTEIKCVILGHKKPYVQKMWCKLCARCSVIVEYNPNQQVKLNVVFKE